MDTERERVARVVESLKQLERESIEHGDYEMANEARASYFDGKAVAYRRAWQAVEWGWA